MDIRLFFNDFYLIIKEIIINSKFIYIKNIFFLRNKKKKKQKKNFL